jgi:hypothetical protein
MKVPIVFRVVGRKIGSPFSHAVLGWVDNLESSFNGLRKSERAYSERAERIIVAIWRPTGTWWVLKSGLNGTWLGSEI